ncbi:MAG: hypothetical protein U0930_18745 [Pirellulales bacterium]
MFSTLPMIRTLSCFRALSGFGPLRKAVLATVVCGITVCPWLSTTSAQDRSAMSGTVSTGTVSTGTKPSGAKSTPTKSKSPQEAAQAKATEVAKSGAGSSSTRTNSSNKSSTATLRLPRYFSGIIDQEQREQIQSIQLEYRTKIDELEKELARVRQDEMQSLEKVLTESQRKLLEKKRNQGKPKPMDSDTSESM